MGQQYHFVGLKMSLNVCWVLSAYTHHSPVLKRLVVAALRDSPPPLTPLHPLAGIPGGPHLVSMDGHRDRVSCVSSVTAKSGGLQGMPLVVIMTGSWDKTLKTWDLSTSGVLKTFDSHSARVLSLALSANGLYAVSGSDDKSVRYSFCAITHMLIL